MIPLQMMSHEQDAKDFIAYVAKDYKYGRACFVLECVGPSGRAAEVISTIGQAFEMRFKEFLKRTPQKQRANTTTPPPQKLISVPNPSYGRNHTLPINMPTPTLRSVKKEQQRIYYNDVPRLIKGDRDSDQSGSPIDPFDMSEL